MSNIVFHQETNEENIRPQQNKGLLPLLRTGKRKALLIAAITALVTVVYAGIAGKKTTLLEYAGNFQLLVEPLTLEGKSSEPVAITNSRGLNDRLLSVDYPTMVRILKSPDLLSEIVAEVQLEYPNFSLERLAENLKVQRIGDSKIDASKILAISYTDTNPELVKLVLSETSEQYLDYSLNSRIQEITQGLEFVEQQLPDLNQKVTLNLNEIQKLQEQYQIVQPDTTGESLLEQIREIKSQQLETQKQIEEQTRIKSNLESKLNISVDEAIAISALKENSNYQKLVAGLKDKQTELAIASATFNSNSPQIINLQEEEQQILDLLNSETRQIFGNQPVPTRINRFLLLNNQDSILFNLVGQLVQSANQLEALQAREQNLSRNIALFEKQAQAFPQISRRYKELQQELDIANRTREQLLVQKDKLQIQASQTQAPWKIVSKPKVISDSEGNAIPLPVDSQNEVLKGLIAGLILGIATAVLIEKKQNTFYTVEDITDITDQPIVLGEIPFNEKLLKSKNQKPSATNRLKLPMQNLFNAKQSNYEHFSFLSAFDKLFANIYLRYRHNAVRSIVISSPSKGDGRSTIALHLAKAIAGRGKKVLLVNANSFDYQLPDRLVSANQASKNLFILVASKRILHDFGERKKLMSEFNANYDFVIYDTPPLLESVTASLLSVNTDGIVFVSAIGRTKKSSFRQAFEQIKTLNLPLLGIVVNHVVPQPSTQQINGIHDQKLLESSYDSNTLDATANYRSDNPNNSALN